MATEQIPHTEAQGEAEPTPPLKFYYSPWGFFRTMMLIAWCTFRHPFSTTIIDLETGEMRRLTRSNMAKARNLSDFPVHPMFSLLLWINRALCAVTLAVMIWIASSTQEPESKAR